MTESISAELLECSLSIDTILLNFYLLFNFKDEDL
jgi:hypothetical protein